MAIANDSQPNTPQPSNPESGEGVDRKHVCAECGKPLDGLRDVGRYANGEMLVFCDFACADLNTEAKDMQP